MLATYSELCRSGGDAVCVILMLVSLSPLQFQWRDFYVDLALPV